jgi:WD40 repeat protein
VWDVSTRQELFTLSGHQREVTSAAFSPDGTHIVSVSEDGTVKVWDVSTRQELFTLSGHQREVTSAAFSPDGSRIVSASEDGTVKVWDVSTRQELFTLSGHTDVVTGAAFSPDGTHIVSASWDGTVRIYLGVTEDLLKLATCRLEHGLSDNEFRIYQITPTTALDFSPLQCPPHFSWER